MPEPIQNKVQKKEHPQQSKPLRVFVMYNLA